MPTCFCFKAQHSPTQHKERQCQYTGTPKWNEIKVFFGELSTTWFFTCMLVFLLRRTAKFVFCFVSVFFVTWQMALLIINLQDGIWTSLNFSNPAGPAKRGERNPVYAFQRILMKMVTWQGLAEHDGTLLLSIYFLLRKCIFPVWNLESCFLVVGHGGMEQYK